MLLDAMRPTKLNLFEWKFLKKYIISRILEDALIISVVNISERTIRIQKFG